MIGALILASGLLLLEAEAVSESKQSTPPAEISSSAPMVDSASERRSASDPAAQPVPETASGPSASSGSADPDVSASPAQSASQKAVQEKVTPEQVVSSEKNSTSQAAETPSAKSAVSEPEGEASSPNGALIAIEKNIIDYTNQERAKHGLPPLQVCPKLMESARQHAAWMTLNRTLRHTSKPVAENIALGQRSSWEAVQDWMRSAGHRANILNPRHRWIGAAAYRTEQGDIYWCQQFRP
jgi:uncharacterized protein YkwD